MLYVRVKDNELHLFSFPFIFLVLDLELVVSYASPPIWKLHSCSEIISKLYKPAFHSSHLSCNTSYGGAATLQVFCFPQQGYLSRLQKVDLVSFYFLSYFIFNLFFIFSIFRTLGLGLEVIGHTITSVTSDGVVTTLIMRLKKRK